MDSAGPSVVGTERKSSKVFEIEFKVFEHKNPVKRISCLKIAKPHDSNCEQQYKKNCEGYPSVTVKTESLFCNDHAFKIMHCLNHRTILSMKTIYKPLPDLNTVSAVVEEYLGTMDTRYCNILADKYGYIPSDVFQRNLRDIIDGIEFLKESETYHGNLSWTTTLYNRAYDIKLANFKEADSIDIRQAQWNDWLAFLSMLRDVHKYATKENEESKLSPKLICDSLEEVIDILSSADIDSLDVIKDKVLEVTFFWSQGRRARFMTATVPLFLHNKKFLEDVRESDICHLPWNTKFPHHLASVRFQEVLQRMNAHRDGLVKPHYNTNNAVDCLRFICGAYTHKNEIQIAVDDIFRATFPKVYKVLKRLVEKHRRQMDGKCTP